MIEKIKFSIRKFFRLFRFNKSISIDLGTANVLIFDKQANRIVLNEPSVIAFDKKTKKVIAVGKEAREMLGRTPKSIIPITPLKDGVIANLDATKEMINIFLNKIYGNGIFKPEVMICIPLDVTSVERKALFESVVGARKVYIIEEGRAAIIGSGVDISKPSGNMVVDIGGGSTDIAILSLNEVIASKSIRIAGNNFDRDIVRFIKQKYNLLIGEKDAEEIKMKYGLAIKVEKPEMIEVKGMSLETYSPAITVINQNELCDAVNDSIHGIISATKEVLEKCPPEIASDLLDNGIVMTGGGALIKDFTTLLEKEVKVKVKLSPNPLDAVVLGGGIAFDNKKLLKTLQMKEY